MVAPLELAALVDLEERVLQPGQILLVPQAELPVLVAAQVREETRHLESQVPAAMVVTRALQEQAV